MTVKVEVMAQDTAGWQFQSCMQYSYGLWWFLTCCNRKALVWLALPNLLVTLINLGPTINKECNVFGDITLTVEYIISCRQSDISWSSKLKFGSNIFIYGKEIW